MRILILTLCLGLALIPTFSQTVKKAPGGNKKPVSSQATQKKSVKPAVKQPVKNTAAAPSKKPNSTKAGTSLNQTVAGKSKTTQGQTKAISRPGNTTAKTQPKPKPKPAPGKVEPVDDKAEFEKVVAIADGGEKIAALQKFIVSFPNSTLLAQAKEQLSATAYTAAESRLGENDVPGAVSMYKLAVESVPKPIPEHLFDDSLSKIPNALYWRGSRAEALEIARALEAEANANQLVVLAMFHVLIENGGDAVRVAELAAKADPKSAKAFQTLGLANRVNFQLEESAAAYAKALELDPSNSNRRNLAEIQRALGKADEAVNSFREILTADPADVPARNGLVLSLFDAGKKDEAESELAKALEQDPKNVMLLGGAAYWYAASKNAEKAVDLAQKAIAAEPRYVWSHIALARGLLLQNKPLEAEEVLLKAKAYGNFPTIEYELASARCMAGFYREAVEGLQKNFEVSGDSVVTQIGGRVERKNASFTDILADERRASILEPSAADDTETAARLKSLLALNASLAADKPDETIIAKSADAFVSGDDKYKLHRQLYAASLLLNKKMAPQKALEYATAAIGGSDTALEVPNAGAAVMASELYDSRQIAFARNELVQIPTVPRQMLSAILRGRIEELAGWALLQQNKSAEATIRFRRAVSIFPDKSAWWRSSMWRLGAALQADGKEPEALDAYIKSYSIDKPDIGRYAIVEVLYKKLNGNTEGLEAKIGKNPLPQIPSTEVAKNVEPATNSNLPVAASTTPAPTPETSASTGTTNPSPTPASSPAIATASPTVEPTPIRPTPTPEIRSTPSPTPSVEPTLTPSPETSPTPLGPPVQEPPSAPSPTPTPIATPEFKPEIKPQPSPEATATPAEVKPEPTPEAAKSDNVGDKADTKANPEPTSQPSPTTPVPTLTPELVAKAEPTEPPPSSRHVLVVESTLPEKRNNTDASKVSSKPKPLFEPIVITIPKSEIPKTTTSGAGVDGRARVVNGQPIQPVDLPPCTVTVSQEKVSLINSGGSISVLVGMSGEGELRAIRAISSSPEDVSVTLDPDIRGIEGRRLYVIKSLSENTGVFQITFRLPCGKKDISVTVR